MSDEAATTMEERVERIRTKILSLPPLPEIERTTQGFWRRTYEDCPYGPHRGAAGPNEDISQCWACGSVSFSLRPEGETFGDHLADCALSLRHEGYCASGGDGHAAAAHRRGYFGPDDEAEQALR